jgi:hypothetical protein
MQKTQKSALSLSPEMKERSFAEIFLFKNSKK